MKRAHKITENGAIESPLKWIEWRTGERDFSNFTVKTRNELGSLIELVSPTAHSKGVMFLDPRAYPASKRAITAGQLAWLREHYFFILTEFWHGLFPVVNHVFPDLRFFDVLMTKDVEDQKSYNLAWLTNCIPYSYSDLTEDLDDTYYDEEKTHDFLVVANPRPFKQVYETFSELPKGTTVLWMNTDARDLENREFGPYVQACLDIAKVRNIKVDLLKLDKTSDLYRYYARARVAVMLSKGEGNYRSLTEVLKAGVPALYVPYIRGGGDRYVHPLRGKGGVGEPVYHLGELQFKAKEMLDHHGDYRARRILELTSRTRCLALMRTEINKCYERTNQQWDGNFYELSSWDPGRKGSYLDILSIPEL